MMRRCRSRIQDSALCFATCILSPIKGIGKMPLAASHDSGSYLPGRHLLNWDLTDTISTEPQCMLGQDQCISSLHLRTSLLLVDISLY